MTTKRKAGLTESDVELAERYAQALAITDAPEVTVEDVELAERRAAVRRR